MAGGYTPSGLAGNSPQGVGLVATDYNFLGAQTLNNFAVLHPDVDPNLTKRYGYQDDIISMFEKLGLSRRVSGSTIYRHYEEERLHAPVTLAATGGGSGGGNGQTVTVNILAGDVFDVDQESPYIGSATTELVVPRVGDVGFFSNDVECVVTAVDASAATFDATPTQADQEVPAISDNDEFIITSSVAEEGSTVSDRGSKSSRVIYYQNNVQIFSEFNKITASARGEDTWIEFDGRYGRGMYWYYYDMDRFFKRQKQSFAHGCLFGKDITNTVLAGISGFETTKKTKGLVPTIEDSGITESYVADSMDLADLDNVLDALTEQMAPNEYMLLCSQGFRKDINKLIREGDGADFVQDDRASIIFANFNGGVQAVDFDIDKIKYLGYNLNVKTQRAFSDPTQLGGITKYANFAIGMPMGEVNIYEELGGSYVSTPSMNVVYKADGSGGDRSLVDVMRTIKETGTDNFEHILITEGGIETNAINHCFVMTGDASA
jgi:hypothetical protein